MSESEEWISNFLDSVGVTILLQVKLWGWLEGDRISLQDGNELFHCHVDDEAVNKKMVRMSDSVELDWSGEWRSITVGISLKKCFLNCLSSAFWFIVGKFGDDGGTVLFSPLSNVGSPTRIWKSDCLLDNFFNDTPVLDDLI